MLDKFEQEVTGLKGKEYLIDIPDVRDYISP